MIGARVPYPRAAGELVTREGRRGGQHGAQEQGGGNATSPPVARPRRRTEQRHEADAMPVWRGRSHLSGTGHGANDIRRMRPLLAR